MNIDIIKNALEYYDKNKDKYENFFKKCKYFKKRDRADNENLDEILFLDKDKKVIHKSQYEILGSFDTDLMLWSWGWSNPRLYKKNTYLISKILNYGINLSPEDIFLKSELITSKFKISSRVQLDMHAALATYLSKKEFLLENIRDTLETEEEFKKRQKEKTENLRELNILKDENINDLPKSSQIDYIFLLNPPKL